MNLEDALDLIQIGAKIVERRFVPEGVSWALIESVSGRQLMVAQRTGSIGSRYIMDPTSFEIDQARACVFDAWSAPRSEPLLPKAWDALLREMRSRTVRGGGSTEPDGIREP